ncbi:MAG: arylesterase [Deltaproteobacteria bacterium]|nr:arylesterase [Deltaproteobacteria bacterium]
MMKQRNIYIISGCVIAVIIVYLLIPSSHEIRNANPVSDTIVCFGDSLTYGTGAEEGMDYPSQLSRLIGRDIINAGIPGDTTASALSRIGNILDLNPGIVFLTLGGNDLKNRVNKDIAFSNLEIIITRLQDKGAMVVLGGIDVPVWGRGFGDAYQDLAEKTGAILVPNVYKDIIGKRHLMSDTIHPNSKGYTIMAKHFYEAIKPYY